MGETERELNRIRNSLWEFLKQTKCNSICLQRYTDTRRRRYRRLSIVAPVLLLFSALGAYCDDIIPIWGSIISAIFIILKDYSPQFFGVLSSSELEEAESLNLLYEHLGADCEYLLFRLDYNRCTSVEAITKLTEFKKHEAEYGVRLNCTIKELSEEENKTIQNLCDNYLIKTFNINCDDDEKQETTTNI